MVAQLELDLNAPLDASKSSKLETVLLSPELATAALTLHGDYYKQAQSFCNARIIWHPAVQLVVVGTLLSFVLLNFGNEWRSRSWSDFMWFVWGNKFLFFKLVPVGFVIVVSLILVTAIITDEFASVSDNLGKPKYTDKLFGFPLRVFAAAGPHETNTGDFLDKALESTTLLRYRESPIAVVTVVDGRITGLNVRKVYKKAGLEHDLVEVAIGKARKQGWATLQADCFSFDDKLKHVLRRHGFVEKLHTTQINPFFQEQRHEKFFNVVPAGPCLSFFGIKRLTYELTLEN